MKNNKEKMVIVKTNPKDGTACPLLDVSNEMAPVCALDNSVPYCKECRKGITRAEAVERMAKAIFSEIWGLPNNRFDLAKCSVKVRNRKLAEAALDALLGKEMKNAK